MTARRVWVTGGAGFLGTAVVVRLLEQGHTVRCLVRNRTAAETLRATVDLSLRTRLEIVAGSLDSIDSCRQLVAGCSAGVHGAAALTGATAALFLNNVVTTRHLLAALADTPGQRMVLVSSIAVHGTSAVRRGGVLDETCPLDPRPEARDPYTFSKVAQERLCWTAARDGRVQLVVIRPGVIYGPGRDCISSRVGIRVGPVLVQMGGHHRLPYTYVDNCADAIGRALFADGVEGESFNIVDDEVPTGDEVVRRYRRRVGRLRTVKVPARLVQPLSSAYHWYSRRTNGQLPATLTAYRSEASWKPVRYSNAKARRQLQWTPAVSLGKAFERTLGAMSQAS